LTMYFSLIILLPPHLLILFFPQSYFSKKPLSSCFSFAGDVESLQ
jgi:hypothetical protein